MLHQSSAQATSFQYNVLLGRHSVHVSNGICPGLRFFEKATYPCDVFHKLERITLNFQDIMKPLHEILLSLAIYVGRVLERNQ
jgi:hypothetical protein